MLNNLARLGDALLGRIVPRTAAAADYCWYHCGNSCSGSGTNYARFLKRTCCDLNCHTVIIRCGGC